MTVSSTTVKQLYSPSSGTTTFAIPFEFENTSQILVYTVDESTEPATETLKTISTHYTLTGGPPVTNVEFNTAPNASNTGIKVLIKRGTSQVQSTDYQENGPFPAESHEEQLDLIVQMIQELKEKLDRAALSRISSTLTGVTLPDPEAGEFLVWNANENNLENATITDGNVRCGDSGVSIGATTKSISFSSSMTGSNYGLSVQWINLVDASPMFQPLMITAKSQTGFTVSWNVPLDSASYSISYIALPAA